MSGGTFEDKIWDNIERNSGEQSDPGGDDGQFEDPPEGSEVDDNDEPDVGDLVDNTKPKAPKTVPDTGKGKKPAGGEPKRDAKGNIIAPDGKVIAKNGAERRLHTQLQRTREILNTQETKIRQLEDNLHKAQVLGGLPKELGLDDNDVKQGLAIVSDFIRDPAKAARDVIQLALSRGVSLQQIVNDDLLPNIQMGALQKMIDQRLPAKEEPRNPQGGGTVTQEEAQQAATRFLADYPEAEIHEGAVARLMQGLRREYAERGVQIPHPYVLAEMALTRLKSFADKNQLDFETDLAPQIQALEQGQGRRTTNGRAPNARERNPLPRQQPSRRPMPNGSQGSTVRERSEAALRPDATTDDIVRAAMRENGYDL